MTTLTISIDRQNKTAVINMVGSADMTTSNELDNQLQTAMTEYDYDVVIDMGELSFICSMALGTLISAHRQCIAHNGRLRMAKPQPQVVKLLQTTRLDRLFKIYPNVSEAVSQRK